MEKERKRFATEELARSGQSANEVANVGSSVPDKILIQIGRVTPSRVRRDPGLTLNYHPYLNFTQQGQKSELRARNSCSTRRRRNLRMKRREEKWEEEEFRERRGRSGQRANLTPNPSSIVAHLHSSSGALFSLSLFPPLCRSLSHSDHKYVACLFLFSPLSLAVSLQLSASRCISVLFLSLFHSLPPRSFNSPCVDLLVLSFLLPFVSPQLSAYPCAHVLSSSLYVSSNCVLRQQSRGRATCQHTLM